MTGLRRVVGWFAPVLPDARIAVEGTPEATYFRFYDPDVLRVYLESCTPAELTQSDNATRCSGAGETERTMVRVPKASTTAAAAAVSQVAGRRYQARCARATAGDPDRSGAR